MRLNPVPSLAILVLGLLGLGLPMGCGSSRSYCEQATEVVAPTAAYPDQTGLVGTALTAAPTVGGHGPITGADVASGTLPPGLVLGPDGRLTGVPTVPGIYTVTVTLRNAEGGRVDVPVRVTVLPAGSLHLTYVSPLTFAAGTAIPVQKATAENLLPGAASTFAVTSGNLPAGLNLDAASGDIQGTPTTPGLYTWTVALANGGRSATATVSALVEASGALALSYPTPRWFPMLRLMGPETPTLANATAGLTTAYSLSGDVPPGLMLDASGSLRGTPTATGVYAFSITAVNGTRTATANLVYTVETDAPLALTYGGRKFFTVDAAIAPQPPALTGATPSLSTAYQASGQLPPGLGVATAGALTGTPTQVGDYDFTISAQNGSRTAAARVLVTVETPGPLALAYATPRVFPVNTAIPVQLPALGNPTSGLVTTYALSGNVPKGLAMTPDGQISGTPTVPGIYAFTITAVNGSRVAASQVTYSVENQGPLALAYATPQYFPVNAAIATQSPSLGNASPGIPTTYAATGLPAGLAINADGTITGTPTAPGTYPVSVTATNGSRAATAALTYYVENTGVLTLAYATPKYFPVNAAIATQTPSVGNASAGVATTYAATGLPAGLAINADGTITGTPTAPGTYPVSVTATNGSRAATAAMTYYVENTGALTLAYATPKYFPVNAAIATQTPSVGNASAGVATTYAATGLPAGLALNADGTITGTPTAPGTYPVSVTATNGSRTATAALTYYVENTGALTLAYATPKYFPVNAAIATQTPSVGNASAGVATTYAATGLPAGLAINADGTITGTPTAPGTYSVSVTATNGSRTATAAMAYYVENTGALTLAYATPKYFPVNAAIATQTPSVGNASSGITTAFAATGLPTGLTLNADGTITGTPAATGVYSVSVTATNGSRTATAALTYYVEATGSLALSYATPRYFPVGAAIATQTPSVGNASSGIPTTFAATGLPTGLTLNADGTITGTPTAQGIYSVSVTATNGSRTATAAMTYYVENTGALTLAYATPKYFPVNAAIATQNPTVGNATAGITTTFAATGLPTGLTLNADGTITGTPTAGGTFSVSVTATNGSRTATAALTYYVENTGALTVSYPTPVYATVNAAIATQTPTVGNATSGITTTFGSAGGTFPAGLTLNADGTITGTPTATGTYAFSIAAMNGSRSGVASPTYYVQNAGALTLSYATPQTFTSGTAISTQSPTLGNATTGFSTSYAVVSGTLSPGLTLNADGTITGTPTTVGTYAFSIRATNGNRTATAALSYTTVSAAPTALNYTTPVTYTATVAITPNLPNASGGAPTSYAVTSGSLPTGLTLNTTDGTISGTPTAAGTFSVTIRGSNGSGNASQSLSITVLAYPTASLTSNPTIVPVGQSSSLTAIFKGGTGVVTGGNLSGPTPTTDGNSVPTGIILSPTSYTYTLTVTSPQGYVATSSTTVQWIPVPSDTWTTTIPNTGGSFAPDGSSALNGQISLVVPSQGGTCGDITLTVNREDTLPGSFPASVATYSKVFNIATDLGYPFKVPVTITLTYDPTAGSPNLGGADLPVPFYWDANYGAWVATGLKSVNTSAKTVTFTTLSPGRYVVAAVPGLASALATQATGFAAGTDGWLQNNVDVYDLPGGAGLGMSSFASWYYNFRKAANGGTGLYSLFPSASDTAAKGLISRLANGTADDWNQVWDQSAYSLTDVQTGLALITGLKVTGQPQLFLMGDARPAVNNALATLATKYDLSTGKFTLLDPNYPGNTLTIAWNASTGAFSSYDRDMAYSPSFAAYAFEGQTTVHRLADYEKVLSGAEAGYPTSSFATVALDSIGGVTSPDVSTTVTVASNLNVRVTGTVTNGDETATALFWSQNDQAPRTTVTLTPVDATHSTFDFTIPQLADPYGTTVMLETTSNPCDPTFSHSGFQQFSVKQASLTPWFPNACFEDSTSSASPWSLQQGSNSGVAYPNVDSTNPLAYKANTFSWPSGEMNGYSVSWSAGSIDSAVVNSPTHAADPYVPSILSVLDGNNAFRINNAATGAHISRLYQTITVPSSVQRPKLSFYWAFVAQSAGHIPSQEPYVDIVVLDTTTDEVLYYVHHFPPSTVSGTAYSDGYPGWISGAGSGSSQWFGISWQKVSLNLGTGRANHNLRIVVTAADCTQGGHGGYAYLDSIGCQ